MKLDLGESVVAESGELSWTSSSIELETAASGKAGAKGVFGGDQAGGRWRQLLHDRVHDAGPARHGGVRDEGPGPDSCPSSRARQRVPRPPHRYLCGLPSVEVSIGFQQKLGAGLFGGAGFILQRVGGSGTAWIELDGEIVDCQPARARACASTPATSACSKRASSFDLDRIKGIKNMVFGGDGIFLAKLTGPGRVWLQTLPIPRLAGALLPYLPQPKDEHEGGAGRLANSLLDNS